jgi:cysteine synthase
MGTTGTVVGLSKRLKELNPKVQVIGVQPEGAGSIQGLKNLRVQYVPKIWNPQLVDEIRYVNPTVADDAARLLALEEGVFVGPSSGATFYVAQQLAKELREGVIVCIAPDGGERYLSTTLCDPVLCLKCARKYGVKCSYRDGDPLQKGSLGTV